MTPSQQALKAYLIAKMGEGAFSKASTPSAVARKAAAELAADLPVVIGDLLDLAADSTAKVLGKIALEKVGAVARDISERGLVNVIADLKQKLDIQYQRGVERQRKRGA